MYYLFFWEERNQSRKNAIVVSRLPIILCFIEESNIYSPPSFSSSITNYSFRVDHETLILKDFFSIISRTHTINLRCGLCIQFKDGANFLLAMDNSNKERGREGKREKERERDRVCECVCVCVLGEKGSHRKRNYAEMHSYDFNYSMK